MPQNERKERGETPSSVKFSPLAPFSRALIPHSPLPSPFKPPGRARIGEDIAEQSRMRRHVIPAVACLSAILAALVAAAWAASGRTGAFVPVLPLWFGKDVRVVLGTDDHSLALSFQKDLSPQDLPPDFRSDVRRHEFLGFRFVSGNAGLWGGMRFKGATRIREVGLPNALALPLLAAFPFVYVRRTARNRRRKRGGLCAHCGYDLRFTPGRCSECGSIPTHRGA